MHRDQITIDQGFRIGLVLIGNILPELLSQLSQPFAQFVFPVRKRMGIRGQNRSLTGGNELGRDLFNFLAKGS